MTPEEKIARKKKFDAITEDCRKDDHFKKFFREYFNDVFYTIGVDINAVAAVFRFKETLGELKPTFGRRKGIHNQLKITIFKELNIIKITPQNCLQVVARYMGMMSNVAYAVNKMEAEADPDDKLIEEMLSEYFNEGNTPEIAMAENAIDFDAFLAKFPPSIQKELATEFGRGVTSIFKDNLEPAYKTSATDIYFALLYFGDYVDTFNTVEECYDYLATRLTTEELGGLTAFRQLWTRIHNDKSN